MQKQLIALLITIFIYTNASAQDWVLVGKAADGSTYYMRNSAASSSSSYTKKVWVKHSSSKITIKKNGKTYTYLNGYDVTLYEFSCDENQIKIHSSVTYDSKGKIVDTYSPKEYLLEWQYVVPESVGETLLKKACEL